MDKQFLCVTQHADLTVQVGYEPWNSRYRPHSVMTTYNGYQWTGVSFGDINEVAALHKALGMYLEAYDEEVET